MAEVACLGIFVADLIGRPIDALPPRGRLGLVEHMTLHIGGCAANTGIDLARLGVATTVLGKVGADGLGDFIVNTLARDGVETRGVVRSDDVGTSASMVIVGADGERTFLHHLGGNAKFHADEVDWSVIDGARILHVAGALVMPEFDGEPMAGVLKTARATGMTTSLDTVWDATGRWMSTLAPCLEYSDYFMPSLAEAQELTGRNDAADVAMALRDRGVGTAILKMGAEGSYIRTADCELRIPAYKVSAVDGTGAGDAYDAGVLCGIVRGWDLERTARFATAVGAMCVKGIGATAGIGSIEATDAFMASQSRRPA